MNIQTKMPRVFRICTEDKQRGDIEMIVSKSFQGYTILQADGYWNNVFEHSLIIEIVTPHYYQVKEVAEKIKVLNNQDAVLIQALELEEIYV
jgi:hypothetical protein